MLMRRVKVDKKDRVIGFAVLNAQRHLEPSTLENMATSGSQWIKLMTFSSEYESIESVKAAKKAQKVKKRMIATEAARAVATPSPGPSNTAQTIESEGGKSKGEEVAVEKASVGGAKKKRVYTGAKISLIPTDGICATTNLHADEAHRTYYSNRFVRDLEWVLNFPFILSNESSLRTSSSSCGLRSSNCSDLTTPSEGSRTVVQQTIPLVSSSWCDLGKTTFEFLSELDANPDLYLPWIRERQARSNNLGGYFTLLIEFLLSRSKTAKTVCAKYQMFSDEKRTVGDFDFLIEMRNSEKRGEEEEGEVKEETRWVHWEVGIKFYLLLKDETPESGFSAFVGPHCTGDSLEHYVVKTTRQLQLRNEAMVAAQLEKEGKRVKESNLFLKGYSFFPLTHAYYEKEQETSSEPHYSGNEADPYPADYWVETSGWLYDKRILRSSSLNGGPVAGWWAQYPHSFPYSDIGDSAADMSESNLDMIRKDDSLDFDFLLLDSPPFSLAKAEKLQYSMWTILNKMDYMSPILVTPDRPDIHLLGYHSLKRAVKMCFATNYRSLFVAEVIPYSKSQFKDSPNPLGVTHVESSRGFIVGQHWPSSPSDIDLSDSR